MNSSNQYSKDSKKTAILEKVFRSLIPYRNNGYKYVIVQTGYDQYSGTCEIIDVIFKRYKPHERDTPFGITEEILTLRQASMKYPDNFGY